MGVGEENAIGCSNHVGVPPTGPREKEPSPDLIGYRVREEFVCVFADLGHRSEKLKVRSPSLKLQYMNDRQR
jgi:hypothetical protein